MTYLHKPKVYLIINILNKSEYYSHDSKCASFLFLIACNLRISCIKQHTDRNIMPKLQSLFTFIVFIKTTLLVFGWTRKSVCIANAMYYKSSSNIWTQNSKKKHYTPYLHDIKCLSRRKDFNESGYYSHDSKCVT